MHPIANRRSSCNGTHVFKSHTFRHSSFTDPAIAPSTRAWVCFQNFLVLNTIGNPTSTKLRIFLSLTPTGFLPGFFFLSIFITFSIEPFFFLTFIFLNFGDIFFHSLLMHLYEFLPLFLDITRRFKLAPVTSLKKFP